MLFIIIIIIIIITIIIIIIIIALMNQTMFLKFMLFNQTRHVSDEPSSIVSCTE